MKSYSQALNILKKSRIIIKDEFIKSSKSLNRVCAENIYSKVHYPSADNSSFDGYAINSRDTKKLKKKKGRLFKILGSIAAGDKPKVKIVKKFQTYEIMTGGIMPKGLNAIIPIEQIIFYPNKKKPNFIFINKNIRKFQNVRLKGSDYKKNDLIVKKGTILQPNHILAFKTLGIKNIKVKKIPNIIFFSTGNEISNKNNIPFWKVRDSHSSYIQSLRSSFLFNLKNGGILKDKDKVVFQNKIKKMINSKIDIMITTGAVSAGKFDYIPNIVKKFKTSNYFKSVMIKPGKPLLFAKIQKKILFSLPGNPISTAACFRFFIYPFIEKILDLPTEKPIKAVLLNNFEKKKSFTRFIKSKLSTTKDGKLNVKLLSGQESFKTKPFVKSNVWAVLPRGQSIFKKGQIIDCFLPNYSNKILN